MGEPQIARSPPVADEVRKTTCYMCACRCGIDVHLRDGKVRFIQGNRDHPVNRGVLCAKGSAGMLHQASPARLTAPLRRVGPRGRGEFETISWDEALATATDWLGEVRARDPRQLAFYTGRDQSQALTGWWAQQYGTPNHAAHGGFCSVNMAAGGIYTIGGAFWEFAQPDWEQAQLLLLFGVAEDHDSNPIKLGLAEMRRRKARIISVNPVRTGYSAIADTWLGITPGTDGLLVLALIRELLRAGQVDVASLSYRTNAPWLVRQGSGATAGLFVRDDAGHPLVLDARSGKAVSANDPDAVPALSGEAELPDGGRGIPVFALVANKYLQDCYAPETVAPQVGLPADVIRGLARELARVAFEESFAVQLPWTDRLGRPHDTVIGRPVAVHAMRGIAAHANGFQTCRALHLLQILLGAVDCPGGTRFKPPYPKPVEAHPRPAGFAGPGQPLNGPPLGYPLGPEDLLVDEQGEAQRLDKAFSWEAPFAAHGMLHMAIPNAVAGDPYPIEVLFLYMANMAWNSSMNTAAAMAALTEKRADGEYRIPKLIVADALASETVAYADLVLPDTTYLERHDCISLLDRPIGEPNLVADAIRHPVVALDRDVRPFQDVLIELGGRLQLPGFVATDGTPHWRDYAHYMVTHERRPGVGPLAGWRGANGDQNGRGEPNPEQLARYITNGSFWSAAVPEAARYHKHDNQAYQEWAVIMGFFDTPQPFVLQLYAEPLRRMQLAAEGHGDRQPPERLRQQIIDHFDPLPIWYPPPAPDAEAYPFHAITQRPMAMYHSWGSHNPWLRQLHAANPIYVPAKICDAHGLADGDWAWLESPHARIRARVKRMDAVNELTIWSWNAIGKRAGAWRLAPQSPEATQGVLLNHLIHELLPERGDGHRWANSDPVTGQAAWYDLRVRIRKAEPDANETWPTFPPQLDPPGLDPPPTGVTLREGVDGMTALPKKTERKLGLLIDLDTCVGCQACVVSCKAWNTSGYGAPLADTDPWDEQPSGAWLNRVHTFEIGTGNEASVLHFPKSCLHCDDAPCVTVCPTGASFKRSEDGIVLVDESKCMGCGLCAWACPYGAREMDPSAGVMKKCTLCVDRIYNENLPPEDREPACVSACPVKARHFGDFADPDSAVSKLSAERGGFDLMPEQGTKPVNQYLPQQTRNGSLELMEGPGELVALADPTPTGVLAWVDRALSKLG